jgi:hypothetical protein
MMTGTMSIFVLASYIIIAVYHVIYILFTIKSGRRTPIAEIPTPDLAVPYAAPKHVKTMADVQPIAPKNGY